MSSSVSVWRVEGDAARGREETATAYRAASWEGSNVWNEPSLESAGWESQALGARKRERRSSSGVVGAPLEEEDEEGGWRSELLRRSTTGSTGLDFREMERKKPFFDEDLVVCCEWSVLVEGAVDAASDLSERFAAKTAAMRRMGRRGGGEGRER